MQSAEYLRLIATRRPSNVVEKHLASRVFETSQGTEIIARLRRRASAAKWMRSFWDTKQGTVVIRPEVSGQPSGTIFGN
jgi:hypothetical protein